MSTAGDIISQSFREGNFTAVGAAPTVAEIAEALPRLHGLVFALLGEDVGEELRDWTVPQTWPSDQEPRHPFTPLSENPTDTTAAYAYVPENVRINVSITSTRTLFLPGIPREGSRFGVNDIGSGAVNLTLNANGRLIDGAASLIANPSTLHGRTWFYRSDLGSWTELLPIADSTDEIPFPEEYDDFFVTGLTMRLSTRFGKQVPEEIVARNASMLARIQRRYKPRARPLSPAELREIMRKAP